MKKMSKIKVLDVGGQYSHLIARRIRELGVYSEICSFNTPVAKLRDSSGIIISGGPDSVYGINTPHIDDEIFSINIPILGICYGHQLMAHKLGGKVKPSKVCEYGIAKLEVKYHNTILKGVNSKESVWMSHGDIVIKPPDGFEILASTRDCPIAVMGDTNRKYYSLQFHPEVTHTPSGTDILRNFITNICECKPTWTPKDNLQVIIKEIKKKAKDNNVFFLTSGGVDSMVAFTLCTKALGKERVSGLYIDTGTMRKNETEILRQTFKKYGFNRIRFLDAANEFFSSLEDVYDPEKKRKIIGKKFFETQLKTLTQLKLSGKWILGQGTIYPDTIESGGTKKAALIKTHHNRIALIQNLIKKKEIIEPLSNFYKDEVREIGKLLELPEEIIQKHPFPGPGLAIRCLCSRTDFCIQDNIDEKIHNVFPKVKLKSAVLPLRTVGVQGDSRSYNHLVVLFGDSEINELADISTWIVNNIKQANRVACLISPPNFDLKNAKIKKSKLTKARIELLREADNIVTEFMRQRGLWDHFWQFPVILIPLSLHGGEAIALRPILSIDGMTAEYAKIKFSVLKELSDKIMTMDGVDAVLCDITNKPPATIEWE